MTKQVSKLAHLIAKNSNLNEEQEAVIAYGMLASLQMVVILLVVVAAGLIFNCLWECICIYLAVGIFRKFTGGVHGKSMGQCILVSTLSITAMAVIAKYVMAAFFAPWAQIAFIAATFITVYIITFIKAPVDSPNKPITKPEKIKRLRISAFIYISLLLVICVFLSYLGVRYSAALAAGISYCVCLSLLWQSATLTPLFTFFKS